MREAARIVVLCVAAAVAYGIVHDQVTVRVCPEYFTVGHRSPAGLSITALGLYWGVVATWWVGAILGVGLALAARAGHRPKMASAELRRPLARLLVITGCCALVVGLFGFWASEQGWVTLPGTLARNVPPEARHRFMADAWAHGASYLVGYVGGLVLVARTWSRRRIMENGGN